MNKLDRAIALAVEAHAGQFRKNPPGLPYVTHPIDVMKLVIQWGALNNITGPAAVLHDTLEDTNLSPELIRTEFGEDVYQTVVQLTLLPAESKATYLADFVDPLKKSTQSLVIKLADRICNVRDYLVYDHRYAAHYLARANVLDEALRLRHPEIVCLFNKSVLASINHDWDALQQATTLSALCR